MKCEYLMQTLWRNNVQYIYFFKFNVALLKTVKKD